jgi:hypothetical protein
MASISVTMNTHDTTDAFTHTRDPFEARNVNELMAMFGSDVKEWAKAQKDYHALIVCERVSDTTAGLLSGVTLGLLLGCALLFLSAGLGLWIGRAIGDTVLGMVIMGGAYIVVALLFLLAWRSRYRDRFKVNLINKLYHG